MKGNVLVLGKAQGLELKPGGPDLKTKWMVKQGVDDYKVRDIKEQVLQYLGPVQSHLYNYILKSLNFSPSGDDLFQEALLKAFRYFESYDPSRSFKTWLFTIAHNLIKNFYLISNIILIWIWVKFDQCLKLV